jgi:hypothetical protein
MVDLQEYLFFVATVSVTGTMLALDEAAEER